MNTASIESRAPENMFLLGSLPILFLKTASPIILIMAANGLFTLVDAFYLGKYVGADALTAVTLMFPMYMLVVALSTLVSTGYSSVFARLLGANARLEAWHALSGAIVLSLCVSVVFIALFLTLGESLTSQLANDSQLLSQLGYTYISILVFFSPVLFILTIAIDTLRCEGKMRGMLVVTLVSTLLNFVFNYLFIVSLQWGVAGSAYGTILAQIFGLIVAVVLNRRGRSVIKIQFSGTRNITNYWREFITLGVPSSLNYIGMSLIAVTILYSLQIWNADNYASTAGAYGILTRVLTFAFLPLLGLSMALQTIIGNNYGAEKFQRSTGAFKIAVMVAIVYCTFAQVCFYVFKDSLGFIFVDDTDIASEIGRILPVNTLLFFVFGPLLMVTTYFQAIGKAIKAAILSLPRTYLLAIPLTLILPYVTGEIGIWYAGPIAEVMMLALTVGVFLSARKSSGSFVYAVVNEHRLKK